MGNVCPLTRKLCGRLDCDPPVDCAEWDKAMEKEQISLALLNLEGMGLIEYDDEEDSFEPTDYGLTEVDGTSLWLLELRKLAPGKVFMESN